MIKLIIMKKNDNNEIIDNILSLNIKINKINENNENILKYIKINEKK